MSSTIFSVLHDQIDRARRIAVDLFQERLERLERLREAMEVDNRPQYWELMDRGTNFSYLPPERRPHLEQLFSWLRNPKEADLRIS